MLYPTELRARSPSGEAGADIAQLVRLAKRGLLPETGA